MDNDLDLHINPPCWDLGLSPKITIYGDTFGLGALSLF